MGKDTDELFSELTKAKTDKELKRFMNATKKNCNILTPLPVWNNYLQNTN